MITCQFELCTELYGKYSGRASHSLFRIPFTASSQVIVGAAGVHSDKSLVPGKESVLLRSATAQHLVGKKVPGGPQFGLQQAS